MPTKVEASWSIRPMKASDRAGLFHICVMTGDAGQSAEFQHYFPELQGLIYAEPYLAVPPCFGFVLVHTDLDGREEIVGCIVGTPDSRRFEAAAERNWYPSLRMKYPKSPYPLKATEADQKLIDLVHKPETTPQEVLNVSRAHIHIDLLPKAQRQGWGRKLMDKAVGYLSTRGCNSLFVGIGELPSFSCMMWYCIVANAQ